MSVDYWFNILQHSPALIVALPLLGAFLTPLIGKIGPRVRNVFVVFISLLTGFFVFSLSYNILGHQSVKLAPKLLNNNIQTYVFGSENAGSPVVRILFEVDAMSAFMIIIGAILVIVAVIYSLKYMKEYTGLDKFYTLVLLMVAGMFGMMMTGDLFNFFVFLEIASIASCALIAFWTSKGESVYAGLKYIVISTVGALFVLFAIAIFYGQYNALNMAVIAGSIHYTFLDKIALVLLLAGLAMKAGIAPMHMWMPDAYGRSPAPISIMLVGATQASLYALFRVVFTIYGSNLTNSVRKIGDITITLNGLIGIMLIALAIITIIIGVIMALKQSNFKRLIAFAAVAEIGYMLLAVGAYLTTINSDKGYIIMAGKSALNGGIFHILNDALDIGYCS